MSSSSVFQTISPRAISPPISAKVSMICRDSSEVSNPTEASMRAWACDPRMSTAARRLSNEIDSVNFSTRGSVCASKAPPHGLTDIIDPENRNRQTKNREKEIFSELGRIVQRKATHCNPLQSSATTKNRCRISLPKIFSTRSFLLTETILEQLPRCSPKTVLRNSGKNEK